MHIDPEGEHWFARELAPIQGYGATGSPWRNFEKKVIVEAMASCKSNGHNANDHFAEVGNMIEIGKGAMRQVPDYRLTRYACYLVAMSGDGNKPEVAAARNYFAISTREPERPTVDAPDGEPWLVAGDACEVLGLDNVTNAIRRLDDDEKSTLNTIKDRRFDNFPKS